MSERYIGIVGAGPIGGILGAHLAAAGEKVVFADILADHLEAIRTTGLQITGTRDVTAVVPDAVDDVRKLADYDIETVFVAVKTTITPAILPTLKDAVRDDTVVVCHQNGLYSEGPFVDVFGRDRVLRTVINYAGVYEGPGRIHFTFFQKANHLGGYTEEALALAETLAHRMTAAGMDTEATGDIHRYDWEKVILNCILGPICAIVGKTMKETLSCLHVPEISDGLLREAIEVARAEGIEWDKDFYESCRRFVRNAGDHKPSMLVDVEAGRRTEVDSQNGVVVRLGREHGIPTPYNETVWTLVKAVSGDADSSAVFGKD